MSAPFPTAEAIIQAARMYCNDAAPTAAGALLADGATYTLANFTAACRNLRRRLANAGVESVTNYATLLNLLPVATTDPSTVVYVSWTEYFDGVNHWPAPVLPPDLVQPLRVWQRLSGATSSQFVRLRPANDGLPPYVQTAYFQAWEWRNNQLQLPGALQSNDLRLLYETFFADITTWDEVVPIVDCQDALAYRIAEQFLRSRGAAGAADMQAKAEHCERELIRPTIRQKQRGQHRRIAYGRGSALGTWGYGTDFGPY